MALDVLARLTRQWLESRPDGQCWRINLTLSAHISRFLAIAAALFGSAFALHAQNTLAVTPNPVYLNATLNGGAVQASVTVTSSPSALIPVTPSTTVSWLSFSVSSPNAPATINLI